MIIDVHHHWIPKDQLRNLNKLMRKGERVEWDRSGAAHIYRKGILNTAPSALWCDTERQVDAMDAAGVDMAILSLASTHEWTTVETAPHINDAMAEAVAKYPNRFAGLCHVALVGKASQREMERAVRQLGLRGVNITTHIGYAGTPADDRRFWPFWEGVAELNVPVVVQPYGSPAETKPLTGFPIVSSLVRQDNILRFMMRMVYGPLLDQFPKLKILCPHLGGGFFAVKSRMASGLLAFLRGEISLKQLKKRQQQEKARVDRHISQLYVETGYPTWEYPELSRALDTCGEDKVLFGTDYPVSPDSMQKGMALMRNATCTARARKKILGQNAAALFGIRA